MSDTLQLTVELPTGDDWDGYGAPATTDAAKAAIRNMTFVPTGRGGILVGVNGEEGTLEVDENGHLISVCWEWR